MVNMTNMIPHQRRRSFLVVKLDNLPSKFTVDGKEIKSRLRGEIIFLCFLTEKNQPLLAIDSFNVTADSVRTKAGDSGRISMKLGESSPVVASYDHKKGKLDAKFKVSLHYPLIDKIKGWERSGEDNFLPYTETFLATLVGEFEKVLEPKHYKFEMLRATISLKSEKEKSTVADIAMVADLILPAQWVIKGLLTMTKHLPLRPVFIQSPSRFSRVTGESFYPMLDTANEIWGKCCIHFDALCPPRYINNDDYRVLTAAEAPDLRNEVDEDDAIEIFVVERWDPVDQYGGGATWSSGTAAAQIITCDNQLPLNQNHLAHELGHVLGLGHPGGGGTLTPGCADSIMEPSGFYADNPSEQCRKNCLNASNPLLCTPPHQPWCIIWFGASETELY